MREAEEHGRSIMTITFPEHDVRVILVRFFVLRHLGKLALRGHLLHQFRVRGHTQELG